MSSRVLGWQFSAGWRALLVLERSAGMSCLWLLDGEGAMLVKVMLKTVRGPGEEK